MDNDDDINLITNCVDTPTVVRRPAKRKVASTFAAASTEDSEGDTGSSLSRKARRFKGTSGNHDDNDPHVQDEFVAKKFYTTPHTSGLFKNNPEVPEIPSSRVDEIKEKLFTSRTFEDLEIHAYLVSNLRQTLNIDKATVVQEKAIPIILNGEDVLIKSQTGSGKTLAYALPIVQHLQAVQPKINRESGLFALIVLPTRELALQTYEWFHKLAKSFNRIVPACFMGGQKRKSEKAIIRRGMNILISTPQRLLDHLRSSERFSVGKVKFLVLDEADRLMDMGYENDVKLIISVVKEQIGQNNLQTILLSATLTEGVQTLAGLSMENPRIVDNAIKSLSTHLSDHLVVPANLHQKFVCVPAKLRLVSLIAFLLWKCGGAKHKILIFMSTQDMVDYHDKLVSYIAREFMCGIKKENDEDDGAKNNSVYISQLHGSMPQQDRSEVFKKFRKAEAGVLFCTDVGARGLDLLAVDWIIQYNAPLTVRDYVHRVGRTARIGAEGNALLFLMPAEIGFVQLLEEHGIRLEQMKVDDILETVPEQNMLRVNSSKKKDMAKSVVEAVTSLQSSCENVVRMDVEMRDFAKKAFLSFVRAYHSYPTHIRHIFPIKDLHLGHIAKSLALQDSPAVLGTYRPSKQTGQKFTVVRNASSVRLDQQKKAIRGPNPKSILLSENASGLTTKSIHSK